MYIKGLEYVSFIVSLFDLFGKIKNITYEERIQDNVYTPDDSCIT